MKNIKRSRQTRSKFLYHFKITNFFKYENNVDTFYAEKIDQARGIMDPFILRRLKKGNTFGTKHIELVRRVWIQCFKEKLDSNLVENWILNE